MAKCENLALVSLSTFGEVIACLSCILLFAVCLVFTPKSITMKVNHDGLRAAF